MCGGYVPFCVQEKVSSALEEVKGHRIESADTVVCDVIGVGSVDHSHLPRPLHPLQAGNLLLVAADPLSDWLDAQVCPLTSSLPPPHLLTLSAARLPSEG